MSCVVHPPSKPRLAVRKESVGLLTGNHKIDGLVNGGPAGRPLAGQVTAGQKRKDAKARDGWLARCPCGKGPLPALLAGCPGQRLVDGFFETLPVVGRAVQARPAKPRAPVQSRVSLFGTRAFRASARRAVAAPDPLGASRSAPAAERWGRHSCLPAWGRQEYPHHPTGRPGQILWHSTPRMCAAYSTFAV